MTLRELIKRGLLEKINQIDVCGSKGGRYVVTHNRVDAAINTTTGAKTDIWVVEADRTHHCCFLLDSEVQLTNRGMHVKCVTKHKTIELIFIVHSFFNPNQLVTE